MLLLTNPLKPHGSSNIWTLKVAVNGSDSLIPNLKENGGEAILKGNLNKKDVNNLKISEPFVEEILVIWSEVFFFQETIVSEEHLLSSPLWQNSLIRIQNKPVFFIKTGLLRVLRKLNI